MIIIDGYALLSDIEKYVKRGREKGFIGIQTAKGMLDWIPYLPIDMTVKKVVFCAHCQYRFTEKCFAKHETSNFDYCSCGKEME